jgi:hypothetical protein
LIKEQDGRERLILGAGGNVAFERQMGQERLDLDGAHVARMPFVVVQDEPLDPIDIRRLGSLRVVQEPHLRRHSIQQFRRLPRRIFFSRIHDFFLAIAPAAGYDNPEKGGGPLFLGKQC